MNVKKIVGCIIYLSFFSQAILFGAMLEKSTTGDEIVFAELCKSIKNNQTYLFTQLYKKYQLEHQGLKEIRGPKSITLLHVAARDGSAAIIDFLVDQGVDIFSHDDNGNIPLDLTKRGSSLFKALLKVALFKIVEEDKEVAFTAFQAKFKDYFYEVFHLRGSHGESVLHRAGAAGKDDMIPVILSFDMNLLDTVDKDGLSAVDWAMRSRKTRTAMLINSYRAGRIIGSKT